MNVVRIDDGRYVEVQGTAETTPFRKDGLDAMLALADSRHRSRCIGSSARSSGDALGARPRPRSVVVRCTSSSSPPGIRGSCGSAPPFSCPPGSRRSGLTRYRDTTPVEETGSTFEANARLKAEGYSLRTPHLVLADDSGLEVDASAADAGVLLARYGGPDLTDARALHGGSRALRMTPDDKRTARVPLRARAGQGRRARSRRSRASSRDHPPRAERRQRVRLRSDLLPPAVRSRVRRS